MTASTTSSRYAVGMTPVDVAYDASGSSMLHLWVDGDVLCGSSLADPVVFTSRVSAVVDLGCVHCERSLKARSATS